MDGWFRTGPSALGPPGCLQAFLYCPTGDATLGLQWHPEEQPAQPPASQLCPPHSSPLYPGGCEDLCAPDMHLNAPLEAAGQMQVLPQRSQSGGGGVQPRR